MGNWDMNTCFAKQNSRAWKASINRCAFQVMNQVVSVYDCTWWDECSACLGTDKYASVLSACISYMIKQGQRMRLFSDSITTLIAREQWLITGSLRM